MTGKNKEGKSSQSLPQIRKVEVTGPKNKPSEIRIDGKGYQVTNDHGPSIAVEEKILEGLRVKNMPMDLLMHVDADLSVERSFTPDAIMGDGKRRVTVFLSNLKAPEGWGNVIDLLTFQRVEGKLLRCGRNIMAFEQSEEFIDGVMYKTTLGVVVQSNTFSDAVRDAERNVANLLAPLTKLNAVLEARIAAL